MSIYDVDYTNLGTQLLPPDKRRTRLLAWANALLTPMKYLHELMFVSYKKGSDVSTYAGGTYVPGDRTIYFFSVYEAVKLTANPPTNTTDWVKVQDNFIGVDERVQYNGTKIVLEYAMNKWFQTQFRQPPGQSDIYITVNQIALNSFIVGASEPRSSSIGRITSSEFISSDSAVGAGVNMVIHLPVAVFNALASTNAQRDSIVRAFVNKYVTAGIIYQVATY